MAKLRPAPLIPNMTGKHHDLALYHFKYEEMERTEAFRDYIYRIKQVRDGHRADLLQGSCVDKHGKSRDNEIRAVIHALDVILSYPALLHRQFEDSEKNYERMQKRTGNPGNPLDRIAAF